MKISENCGTKRWSSCSTVFVGDGCLARPDVNDMLWSASVAIRLLMSSDLNRYFSKQLHKGDASHTAEHLCSEYFQDMYEDVYKTFDERIYPVEHSVCDENSKTSATGDREYPDARTIQQFLRGLFSTAILGPECAIVALIFLERLIVGAEVAMISWTWRRQLLACVLLASKVLDDQAVWNIDYCQILRDIHVEDLNALERHTLRLLQFNINVPFGVYARYYFDLLTVGETAGVANQIIRRKRLTPERARNFRILPINPEISALDKTVYDKGFLFDLPSSVKLEALNNEITNRKNSIVTKSTITKGNKGNTQKQFNKTPFVIRNQSTTNCNQYIENCDLISIHKSLPADVTNYQSSNDFNSMNDSLGPIQLDDETEFVNSTFPPFFNVNNLTSQSKQIKLKCADRIQKNSYQSHRQFPMNCQKMSVHYRKYQSNSLGEPSDRPNCSQDCNAPCPSLSSTGRVDNVNDSRTGTEFIRSLMGGDAAYSLLRDSGLY
nr:unnamed protein product [Trichobilharzia regenti]